MSVDHGRDARAELDVALARDREIDRLAQAEGGAQDLLVFGQRVVQLAERGGVDEIADANAAASDLVFVAGADAAGGGPDGSVRDAIRRASRACGGRAG